MLSRAIIKFFNTSLHRNSINRSIKQAKSLKEILSVFAKDSQNFDSVHHMFFLQRYLHLNPHPDQHVLHSLAYL